MELLHLKGNTYYISNIVNIGLYKINETECILIDSGYGGTPAEELVAFLKSQDLFVKAIVNSHGHRDHMGGNSQIIEAYNAVVYASKFEDAFIERPDLASLFLYPSAPFKAFNNVKIEGSQVDYILPDEGQVYIDSIPFEIVNLAGHSPNQIGVVTPDDVFFTADAYVCKNELENIKILYSYDLTNDLACKDRMLSMNHALYVPTHGQPTEDLSHDIQDNKAYYTVIMHAVKSFLSKPKTLDELMKDGIALFDITPRIDSYMVGRGCIAGIISHLERIDEVQPVLIDNIMKFELTDQA